MSNIAKGGYRKDLGIYIRSKMEANICRHYKLTEIEYNYEPKEFEFKAIKRGNRYYKPDFYLPIIDLWVECKGWFRPGDKTKLRRFKKYYPEEFSKLQFIIPDKYSKSKANGKMIKFLLDDLGIDFNEILNYKDMEKYSALIPGWE